MIQQFNQQNINSYLHHNVVFVRLKVVAFSDAEKAAGVRFSARFFTQVFTQVDLMALENSSTL